MRWNHNSLNGRTDRREFVNFQFTDRPDEPNPDFVAFPASQITKGKCTGLRDVFDQSGFLETTILNKQILGINNKFSFKSHIGSTNQAIYHYKWRAVWNIVGNRFSGYQH